MKYHNKQIGKAVIFIMVAVMLLINFSVTTSNLWPIYLILGVVTFLFSSMTINIKGNKLTWYFGPKFWKKEIALSDIRSIKIVRTSFFNGLGIRLTSNGMLYNVSGLDAVEIKLISKTVYLGTNEPNDLYQAINKHLTSDYGVNF